MVFLKMTLPTLANQLILHTPSHHLLLVLCLSVQINILKKHIERFNNCQARYIIFLYLWYHLKRRSKKGSGSCAWVPRIEPNESSHFLSDYIIITLLQSGNLSGTFVYCLGMRKWLIEGLDPADWLKFIRNIIFIIIHTSTLHFWFSKEA